MLLTFLIAVVYFLGAGAFKGWAYEDVEIRCIDDGQFIAIIAWPITTLCKIGENVGKRIGTSLEGRKRRRLLEEQREQLALKEINDELGI